MTIQAKTSDAIHFDVQGISGNEMLKGKAKVMEQYFSVMAFIMLYRVVLT